MALNINWTAWQSLTMHLLYFTWYSFILSVTIFLIIWGVFPSPPSACKPDNSFSPFSDDYTWWSEKGFFEITLRSWSLTFTEAKAIDVCWDLLIGRGGQALIAYISWQTFTRYISLSIERAPVTYKIFQDCFTHQESTIFSIYRLVKDLQLFHNLSSRITKTFMAFALCIILVFPTFAGVMTGYSPRTEAFVRDLDGNRFIKFSDFNVIAYIVHDGWRIGQSGNLAIPYRLPEHSEPLVSKANNMIPKNQLPLGQQCDLIKTISNYVRSYGFHGLLKVTSSLNDTRCVGGFDANHPRRVYQPGISKINVPIALAAPVLNISAFYLGSRDPWVYGYDWLDPRTQQYPLRNKTQTMFIVANQTYSIDYIVKNGRCQPVSDQYQWGFSYLQLFAITIILLIWTIGIGILWLKAEINLPLSQYESGIPQGWECVLHMAKAMRQELKAIGIEQTRDMADKMLQDAVSQKLGGGHISFGAEMEHDAILGLKQWFRAWWKREKLWILAFGFHYAVFVTTVFLWLLWRPVWVLLTVAWTTCFLLYLFMLVRMPKLMWVVLALFWLAAGIEGLRITEVI